VTVPLVVHRLDDWPQKADLFVMRTDGQSCSRETVAGILPFVALNIATRVIYDMCSPIILT
jgi:hypothetical protein